MKFSWLVQLGAGILAVSAGAIEPIRISPDGSGFVLKDSGKPFSPWGFNYLGESETIFEEYWASEWAAIEEDFREMKKAGANVVRVHLQLATYLAGPSQTRPEELARLRKLLDLAQEQGLYLDLTGLGCYRASRVPPWYDAMPEAERWAVQALFWEEVARIGSGHPAVFCYDLMNEPVITAAKPGEHPWLTGELGGFHFVQRISNQPGQRTQAEIAAAWVEKMTQAIRKADPEGLITVGVIPWALVWPNAKPVFYSPQAAKHLDFVSVHFYPKKGEVAKALTALKVYDIGKPLVVEEIYPMECSLPELEEFMNGAGNVAEGLISHYFGRTAGEYRKETGSMRSQLIAQFLEFWQQRGSGVDKQ